MSSKQVEMSRRNFLLDGSRIIGGAVGVGALVMPGFGMANAAKPDRRIKIGQIGTGHAHARGKMETLRKLTDEFEVVAIVESDPQRRKTMENHRAYKGLKWMTEEQLLNTKGLQAVAVETEKRHLVTTAIRCANAGMHIHLDKPAGESLSDFKKLLDQTQRRRLTVQLGYMFRYNPAFRFCFEAVRTGLLGDIFEVHGVISKTVDAAKRRRVAEYSGGTMFNLGCHLIDALVIILGKPQRVTPYVRHTRPEQDSLADNQLAVFEYAEATATIRSTMMEVDGVKRRQFVVCGDKGTIDIRPLEPPRMRLALAKAQGPYKKGYQDVEFPPMPGRYHEQLIEFAQIVRGEKTTDYSPAHDLAAHEAVLRASGVALDCRKS